MAQKMTAQVKNDLKANGCPDDCVAAIEQNHDKLTAMGLDWARLFAMVQKYGPVVWSIIQELLSGTAKPVNPDAPPATS